MPGRFVIVAFLFISFFLGIGSHSTAQSWMLVKEKNGIRVFTSSEEKSKFKIIKVEAVMSGHLQELLAALINVKNTKQWVYATREAYLLKQVGNKEVLYYTETALPWPLSNRDVIIRMRINYDPGKNTLLATAQGEQNILPEKKGIVRLPFFSTTWDVKYDGKEKLYITYVLKMDPGGEIPPGIANMFVTKGPWETFNNLSKILQD